MSAPVPVIVCARNEERALGACLRALLVSAAHAEKSLGIRYEIRVVLDRCTDASERVARGFAGVQVLRSLGAGKVEAQRTGVLAGAGPFYVFCDADVLASEGAVLAVSRALLDDPTAMAASPVLRPLRPVRSTPLAEALFVYNDRRGYERARGAWFSGRFVALRAWSAPSEFELRERARSLGRDRFYAYERGLVVDDVYLSRALVRAHGPASVRLADGASAWFAPPETLRGMYRYYRRLRWALERTDRMFPELASAAAAQGARVTDGDRLAKAPLRERLAMGLFDAALAGCKLAYRAERAYWQRAALGEFDPWPVVQESKRAG